MKTTERGEENRARVLAFLRTYRAEHDWPPTLREIQAGAGLSSTSQASYHCGVLAEQGLIVWNRRHARSIVMREFVTKT